MLIFALCRILQAIPILLGVSLVVFGLVHIVPGNPIDMLMPPEASPEVIARMKTASGFDKPLYMQYLLFGGTVLPWPWRDAAAAGMGADAEFTATGCRDRHDAAGDEAAHAPVYPGVAVLDRAWWHAGSCAGDHSRHAAEPGASAARLPVRATLPLRDRRVPSGPGAGGDDGERRDGPVRARGGVGSGLEEGKYTMALSKDAFGLMLDETGLRLTDAQKDVLFAAYPLFQAMVARATAPMSREAEPSVMFTPEVR